MCAKTAFFETHMSICVWHDSSIRATWLIQSYEYIFVNPICVTTCSYAPHDSSICVAWRIHTCGMMHSYVQLHCTSLYYPYGWDMSHYSPETQYPNSRDAAYSYVPHDSFSHVTRLIHTRDMNHSSPGQRRISGWRESTAASCLSMAPISKVY